jgi:8-oxo-dGTP diphosphatase
VHVADPIRRTTARVVPVNERGEALLMLSCDPARPEVTYLCSIGGAIDEGETLPEAGARELREETGLVVTADQARLVASTDVVGPDGSVLTAASNFVADDVTGPFAIDDPDGSVLEARWFPRAEAIQLVRQVPYPPIAVPVVAYLTGSVPVGTRWVFTAPRDDVSDELADGGWTWRVSGS